MKCGNETYLYTHSEQKQ